MIFLDVFFQVLAAMVSPVRVSLPFNIYNICLIIEISSHVFGILTMITQLYFCVQQKIERTFGAEVSQLSCTRLSCPELQFIFLLYTVFSLILLVILIDEPR